VVAGLTPAKPVDALELRLEYFAPSHEIVHTGRVGTPCAKAKDAAHCADAFAHAKGTTGGEWLVWTRGDEVGAVGGKAAVLSFLAPIDTPQDAAAALVYSLADGNSAAAVLPPCDPSTFRAVRDGYETDYVLTMLCRESVTTRYHVARDGTVTSTETARTPRDPNCQLPVMGRRPEALRDATPHGHTAGRYFAQAAWFEAASVFAFRRLEAELAAHGAPASLRRRARSARSDEVRHARVMRKLARRECALVPPARVGAHGARSLESIAIENAVEGCVHETWAALVATWQAAHAADPELREVMTRVARDETRHAVLAWDVDAWIRPHLTPDARARVDAARAAALDALHASSDPIVDDVGVARRVGLPDARAAATLKRSCTALARA
jgi:hypothetical protein